MVRDRRGVEQAAAVVRRQADRLAVAGHGRGLDELAVGGVGPAIAVDLQVGEQRPQDGQFAADGAIGHARGCQPVTPGGDVLRPHGGQVLEGPGGDSGMGQELVQVVLVGFAGMRGGGAKQPGSDRPADRLAEIAGHLAGKGRDGRGNRPWGTVVTSMPASSMHPPK